MKIKKTNRNNIVAFKATDDDMKAIVKIANKKTRGNISEAIRLSIHRFCELEL